MLFSVFTSSSRVEQQLEEEEQLEEEQQLEEEEQLYRTVQQTRTSRKQIHRLQARLVQDQDQETRNREQDRELQRLRDKLQRCQSTNRHIQHELVSRREQSRAEQTK